MPIAPRSRPLLAAALALAGLAAVPTAGASAAGRADYVPGEVVVRYAPAADRTLRATAQRVTGTGAPEPFAPHARVLKIRDGKSVEQTVAELRRAPGVLSATPNYRAHIARAPFVPNDPGVLDAPMGWRDVQWNFAGPFGVNAPPAWGRLLAMHRAGGRGATIAVLDTGVAYATRGRFLRSPDLSSRRFVRGYDFVSRDPYPNDENGHGTHVASTIAESTGNDLGVTGLAYGARLMPVRVLDAAGEGDSADIAAGIRFAARHGAQVINLSFEFGTDITAAQIPEILDALRYARAKGVLVVGASGNEAAGAIAYPARAAQVLSVGATTEHGCLAEYSNQGRGLDLVAPGGGSDAPLANDPDCRPTEAPGRTIYQVTFARERDVRTFGLPDDYQGTSMAAPHVSAIAGLVIASRALGRHPSPAALEARLKATARDLGPRGPDARYGAGLVDAGAAVGASRPVVPTAAR
jgi:serine protease